jgi:hypothetical protein
MAALLAGDQKSKASSAIFANLKKAARKAWP